MLSTLARKTGQTVACRADAERLLRSGEVVGVWPEGFKGIGKPFSERYQLQRFGRGGFVTTALNAGVPIMPCSIVGAEEIYPKLADLKPLAKALGLPYFPVTPLFPLLGPLGAIPLPTKWHIDFGDAHPHRPRRPGRRRGPRPGARDGRRGPRDHPADPEPPGRRPRVGLPRLVVAAELAAGLGLDAAAAAEDEADAEADHGDEQNDDADHRARFR